MTRTIDDAVARRTRAHLAKADATELPDEAPTLGERPQRFRRASLLADANRVDDRLGAAAPAAPRAADRPRARSAEVVLRDRRSTVDEVVAARHPRLGTRWVTASSAAGFASGRAAADGAALGHRAIADQRGLPRGGR